MRMLLVLLIAATMPFTTMAAVSTQTRPSTSNKRTSSGPKLIGTADNGFRFYNDHTIKTGGSYHGKWENRDGYMTYSMESGEGEEIGFIYHGIIFQLFCGSDLGMSDLVAFNPVTEILQTTDYDGNTTSQSLREIEWNEYNTTGVSWKNTPGNHRIGKIVFPGNQFPETYIFGDGSCEGLELECIKGDGYCLFYGGRGDSALLVDDYFIWPAVDKDNNPTVIEDAYNFVVIEDYSPELKAFTGVVSGENPDLLKTFPVTPYLVPQNKVNVTWYDNR